MEEKTTFEYEAKAPEKKSKLSSAKAANTQNSIDPREREMINRALNKIKLSRDAWNALAADIRDGVGKTTICHKYGIKSGYYKYIKKIITGN